MGMVGPSRGPCHGPATASELNDTSNDTLESANDTPLVRFGWSCPSRVWTIPPGPLQYGKAEKTTKTYNYIVFCNADTTKVQNKYNCSASGKPESSEARAILYLLCFLCNPESLWAQQTHIVAVFLQYGQAKSATKHRITMLSATRGQQKCSKSDLQRVKMLIFQYT